MIFHAYTSKRIKNKNAGEIFTVKDPSKTWPAQKHKIPKYSKHYVYLGTIKAKKEKIARRKANKLWPDAPFIDLLFGEYVTNKHKAEMGNLPKWTPPPEDKKRKKRKKRK